MGSLISFKYLMADQYIGVKLSIHVHTYVCTYIYLRERLLMFLFQIGMYVVHTYVCMYIFKVEII